jgi:ribosomal-protein-alanine N-acetyltransferase
MGEGLPHERSSAAHDGARNPRCAVTADALRGGSRREVFVSSHSHDPATTIQITPMHHADLSEVMAIEVASFSLPWTEEMFANELARGTLAEALVARASNGGSDETVVGYICVWVVSQELHINNLAVIPRWRRQGVAARLLEAALAFGHARGATEAFLEVRASNQPALQLYRRFGFSPVGMRARYYTHPVEDAVIMRRDGLE